MDRRQFAVFSLGALVSGRITSASLAPVAVLQALQVNFYPAPHDVPLRFFDDGLDYLLDELRNEGVSFSAGRLPPLHRQREGYLNGAICLSPTSTFPPSLVIIIAVFLSSFYPERRVGVALGKKTVTVSRPEDLLLLPTQFPELTHTWLDKK